MPDRAGVAAVHRLTKPTGGDQGMIAAPNFNLTIVYESIDAGKRAKCFCDQFIAEAAIDCPFELNLWNFGVLGIPEVRNMAASTAAIADMVILSMSGTVPLPAQTVEWIEMWTWLIDGRRPAVVALFADHHRHGAAIRAYLRRSTSSKKLDFFPIVPRVGELAEGIGATDDGDSRAAFSLPGALLARNGSSDTVVQQPRL